MSMTTMETSEWKTGDRVKIKGSTGIYVVQRDEPNADGSISLYGGDKDPNGCRGFRDIMPERLKAAPTSKVKARHAKEE